jgi:hypothetical protein
MPSLFALNTLKSHWALMPVVAICGTACVMCAGYIGYMCVNKADLSFRPRSWNSVSAPYQSVGATELRKFYSHKNPIVVDPEIEALKRELGSYKS